MKSLPRPLKWGIALIFLIVLVVGTNYFHSTPNFEKSLAAEVVGDGFIVHIPQRGYMRSKTIVTLEAPQGTNCELVFITPDGIESNEEGLGKTIANVNNLCQWVFVIEEASRKGSGRLIFYVNGLSETHFMELRRAY